MDKQKELLQDLREQLSASKMSKEEYAARMIEEYSLRVTDIIPEYPVMLFDVKENNEKDFDKVLEKLKMIEG